MVLKNQSEHYWIIITGLYVVDYCCRLHGFLRFLIHLARLQEGLRVFTYRRGRLSQGLEQCSLGLDQCSQDLELSHGLERCSQFELQILGTTVQILGALLQTLGKPPRHLRRHTLFRPLKVV